MISEEALARAAREAGRALADGLPAPAECQHTFSPAFEEKMDRLLRRRRRRRWYRGLRQAACFLAAVALGGAIFLGGNVQARAAFFGWVQQQVENAQRYFYQGSEGSREGIVHYRFDVPDGYVLEEALEVEGFYDYYYVDDSGDTIEFTYQYDLENTSGDLYVDDRNTESKQVVLHGEIADLYLSQEEGTGNTIIWMDQRTGALLDLTASLDEKELVALAESVAPVEK